MPIDPRLRLAPCARITPYLPAGSRPWGRTRVGLRCEDGPTHWNVSLPVTVQIFAPALVLREPLPAGAELSPDLLAEAEVRPAGLGARDTLRLEAGLCLYGHDINEATSPVEAGLTWAIQKVRRPGGARAGGYPGAAVIERHIPGGAPSKRVGLLGLERVPVREGTVLFDGRHHKLGTVTSGTLAPTVNQPIAMAYLPLDHAQLHHEVYAEVRGKRLPMRVTPMPFTPHHYKR